MLTRVAVVQTAPVFLDKEATVNAACRLIKEAAGAGASLVVFPEAFIAGYPDWVWVVPNNRKPLLSALYVQMLENAVTIPDEATERLTEVAREAGVNVVIGINERNAEASGSSLFNTILFIDSNGKVLGKHRKLVPTSGERTVWAQGTGNTFAVYETSVGRVGGLICWENYMPLARQALYTQGVQVYVAPTWDSSDAWLASMRHIAREGACYVIGCCTAVKRSDLPDSLEFTALYPEGREWINRGNSCVVAPDGKIIAGPFDRQQGLFYCDLDLSQIASSKWMLDVAGHYARPDVFEFSVRTTHCSH